MQHFLNNYRVTLLAAAGATETQITVPEDDAARLVGLGNGDHYSLTYAERNAAGKEVAWEIIHVTGRSGGVLDVQRGREGTEPLEIPEGAELQMRLTAGTVSGLVSQLASHTQALADLEARVAALEHDPYAPQTLTTTLAGSSYVVGYTKGLPGRVISPTGITVPGHGDFEVANAQVFADTPRRFVLIFEGAFPPEAISSVDVMGVGLLTFESVNFAINEQDGANFYTVYEWNVASTDWLESIGQDRTLEIHFA